MESLSEHQRDILLSSLEVLDANFSPPLLWNSPKLSTWYAVGLLARKGDEDIRRANNIIKNVLATQYKGEPLIIRGTFPRQFTDPRPSLDGPVYPTVYGSFDPNNALFFTLGGIVINSLYSDLIEPDVLSQMRIAMRAAVDSDALREGGKDGDNLLPCYSNAWYMRCVCCAYVAAMDGDSEMAIKADAWAQEAIDLFDRYGTISEFNSPTYAGVTFLALGLSQFLPKDTTLAKAAPRLMASIWEQTVMTYNPTLRNVSGPWDRTYGYDMTKYCNILGFLFGALNIDQQPYPQVLNGSDHIEDAAVIPMLMRVSPFITKSVTPEMKRRLSTFDKPWKYETTVYSPPYDNRPRLYTFWNEDGLSAGGVDFDETVIAGPSINPDQFAPGVILWDSGLKSKELGCISYHPTEQRCAILASSSDLAITYPKNDSSSPEDRELSLNIWLPAGFSLSPNTFSSGVASLPGLELSLSGNVFEGCQGVLSIGPKLHGRWPYRLTFSIPRSFGEGGDATLVIGWKRTGPPKDYLPC